MLSYSFVEIAFVQILDPYTINGDRIPRPSVRKKILVAPNSQKNRHAQYSRPARFSSRDTIPRSGFYFGVKNERLRIRANRLC